MGALRKYVGACIDVGVGHTEAVIAECISRTMQEGFSADDAPVELERRVTNMLQSEFNDYPVVAAFRFTEVGSYDKWAVDLKILGRDQKIDEGSLPDPANTDFCTA